MKVSFLNFDSLFSVMCILGDVELMNSIRDYMTENVRRGEKMVQGLLVSLGQRVSRQRIRDCMRLLDPDGVHIRQLRRLKRRVYEVLIIFHVYPNKVFR